MRHHDAININANYSLTGGIGAATATAFAAAGARHVFILGRTESSLRKTAETISAKYPKTKITPLVADISSQKSISAAFTKAHDLAGSPIDIFISNAAYTPDFHPIQPGLELDFFKSYEVNVLGALYAAHAFIEHTHPSTSSDTPILINVSTGAAHVGVVPGYASYATSKLAAAKMHEYLAQQHPHIRIVNVQPGIIESTALATKATADTGISFPQQDTVNLPANFMVWLASGEGSFFGGGRFVWANWDVKELIEKRGEYEANGSLLTLGLNGWPQ